MRRMITLATIVIGVSIQLSRLAAADVVTIALPVASLESMPIYVAQEQRSVQEARCRCRRHYEPGRR